jgi:hypothetical protein
LNFKIDTNQEKGQCRERERCELKLHEFCALDFRD